jgi:glycosyltransferase involved in cell wall biosynthesis
MPRPRIGVDFHTWDGIFQGSRSHILGVYRAAIEQAPDLDFVFFLSGTDSLRQAHPEFSRPNVTLVQVGHVPALARLAFQLPWLSARHGIDILHTQYRVPPIIGCKTACTIHDLLCESHPQFFSRSFVLQSRLTFRLSARMADVLFTVSDFSRQAIVQYYKIAPDHVSVTYNGVDTQRFKPGDEGRQAVAALGLEPGNYILTVGRLEPRKNQGALVRAWSQLGPSAPQLVIVGQQDFGFDDVYQAQADAPRKAIILDKVSDAQLTAVLRHAKVFAYPAFAEGFGMPVIEAMASGVPVITSNTTSMPEVAGGAAILVDPASVSSITQGLQQCLADDALRQRMIAQGLAQAASFNWAASARVLVASLRKALG